MSRERRRGRDGEVKENEIEKGEERREKRGRKGERRRKEIQNLPNSCAC